MSANPETRGIFIEDSESFRNTVAMILSTSLGIKCDCHENNDGLNLKEILASGEIPEVIISDNDGIGELGLSWLIKIREEINSLVDTGGLDASKKPLLILQSGGNFEREDIQRMAKNHIKFAAKEALMRGKNPLKTIIKGSRNRKQQLADAA